MEITTIKPMTKKEREEVYEILKKAYEEKKQSPVGLILIKRKKI